MKIPMMPKGVEHWRDRGRHRRGRDVKIPMMPKGVEHESISAEIQALRHLREDSNDAERR